MRKRKRVSFGYVTLLMALLLLSSCGRHTDSQLEPMRLLALSTSQETLTELDGSTVFGSITIQLESTNEISSASFYFDTPSQANSPVHVANEAPFSFELDTTSLSDGSHTLTVVVTTEREPEIWESVNATFTVFNGKEVGDNVAPTVDAGKAQTVTLPARAELQGAAFDDGLPSGTLRVRWSKESGPGSVVFGSPRKLATTATFSVPGRYSLKLNASDGQLEASAVVAVEVLAADGSPNPDPDPIPDPRPDPDPSPGHWQPKPGLTWYWQLSGDIDMNRDVDVYDIDYLKPASVVAALHAQGKKVIAYVPVGDWESYRPDSDDFPAASLCGKIDGWPERYIDIRNPKAVELIKARVTLAASKGFDGIEGDVVDLHLANTGCASKITEAQMTAFLRDLTEHAHSLGLAYFAKNVTENAAEWSTFTDGVVVEEAYQYNEAAGYMPYIEAGKPVFAVEYGSGNPTREQCQDANARGYALYGTNLSLTGEVYKTCW